jgi:hypothetical protein
MPVRTLTGRNSCREGYGAEDDRHDRDEIGDERGH